MLKLIVNADDFGFDANRNKAISECVRLGWVSNTTLMVNMSGCEEAVAIARRDGFEDRIGLHLNLMEGTPLTEGIKNLPRFCNGDGCFNGVFVNKTKFFERLTAEEKLVVAEEITAQFRKYLDLGLPVRHFDSHCYSHTKWGLVPVVCSIAKEFGFKTSRRPLTLAKYRIGVKRIFPYLVYLRMKGYGFGHADDFTSPSHVFNNWGMVADGRVVELMVHPMYYKDGKLDLSGELSDSGLRRMEEVANFLRTCGQDIVYLKFKDIVTSC